MDRRSQACQEQGDTSSYPQRDVLNSLKRENNSRQVVVPAKLLLSLMSRIEDLESESTRKNAEYSERITHLEEEVTELRRVDDLSRSKKRADAKIKKMLITNPLQRLYWRTVYHMLNDFFDAYRSVKTELMLPNEELKETTGRKGVKLITKGASKLFGGIPVLGQIVGAAESIVKHRVEKSNRKDFKLDTEAVVSFLRYNNDGYSELEEEISLSCYDAAIELAHIKEDVILAVTNEQSLKKMKNSKNGWFKEFWDFFSEDLTNRMSQEDKAVYCIALKDVTKILAHICQYSEEMKNEGDITAQFIRIVGMPEDL